MPGYEWLVVDGDSRDGTREYLASTGADFTSEPDRGIYDAMNKGIGRANGQYLLFLNAGDELTAPDMLEKIATSIAQQKTAPDFVYGDFMEERGTVRFLKRARPHAKKSLGLFTSHQSMLYRRAALGAMRYNLDYTIAADYDLTCRLLQQTDNVLYLPLPLSIFADGGLSKKNAARGRKECTTIRKKLKLCTPAHSAFIHVRQYIGALLQPIAPRLFLKLRNLEGF